MKPETKYNLKAFMWDRFILPLHSLTNTGFIRNLFLVLIFASIIIFKSVKAFLTFFILTFALSIYELVKYYKSGEYKDNYRKFKYPDFRKTMKEIRQAKKTPINNIGDGEKQDHFEPPLQVLDSSALPVNINHETENRNSE